MWGIYCPNCGRLINLLGTASICPWCGTAIKFYDSDNTTTGKMRETK